MYLTTYPYLEVLMTYQHTVLPDEPIVVVSINPDYLIARDMGQSTSDGRALLDSFEERVFWIIDVSQVKVNVNDVINASNQGTRGDEPLWHHPNIRELILITQNKLVQMAASGLNSLPFGNLEVKVFGLLDEALAYCREKLNTG